MSFPERLAKQASDPLKKDVIFINVWSSMRGIEKQLTFAECYAAVISGGEMIKTKHNIQQGDRVALLTKGTLEFFVVILSLQYIGATPVLLNWRQSVDTLSCMCRNANVSALCCAAPFTTVAQQLDVKKLIQLDNQQEFSWKTTFSLLSGHAPVVVVKKEEEAMIFFTSGSTSQPKPVVHTNKSLLWSADKFPVEPGTKNTLCFMPNFHVLQTFQNFLVPLVHGFGCSIHSDDATVSISPRLLLSACAALNPTTIDTVPFIMTEWSTMSRDELFPLTRCAAVRSGGAPLPTAVATRLMSAGIRVQTHYGQTESPGMQLLTVTGAAPDELAVMIPPWDAQKVQIKVRLDNEQTQQGELLISGCYGSSPGYLKDGKLIAGSSRQDSEGWHHTGDIFRWVTTKNGSRGLRHVSRNDDLILLSTGEMFNPVPFEEKVQTEALQCGLDIVRLVVLGHDRAMPFLVVEMGTSLVVDGVNNKKSLTEKEIKAVLEGIVNKINESQVEYARIRSGHILILDGRCGETQLPHSIKGNVLRSKAESVLGQRLTELADVAAENIVDWQQLAKQARDCGYGDDVEKYLSERGASDLQIMGVDSLGVAALTTRRTREADRINDNVKAWTITCVVMTHWYMAGKVGGGPAVYSTVNTFYNASSANRFQAVSFLVQICVRASFFTNGISSGTPSLAALTFVIGRSDAARDDRDNNNKLFGQREKTIIGLIFGYKFIIYLLNMVGYVYAWKPSRVLISLPIHDLWFIYALFTFRLAVYFTSQPKGKKVGPACLLIGGSLILLILGNEDTVGSLSINFVGSSLPTKIRAFLLSFLFDNKGIFVLESSYTTTPLSAYPSIKIVGDYVYVFMSSTSSIAIDMFVKFLKFVPFYSVGYFYGDLVCQKISKHLAHLGTFALVCLAYLSSFFIGVMVSNWEAYGQPWALWNLRVKDDYQADHTVPDWIWQPSGSSKNTLGGWRPLWARPLYVLLDYALSTISATLLVAACIAAPFRASRCGNAALGKFLFCQCYPTLAYVWVLYLVSLFGSVCGKSNFFVQIIQIFMLIGYPFFFLYFYGPILTAFILFLPRLFFFTGRFLTAPMSGLVEARHFLQQFPSSVYAFWVQYFYEIARDWKALKATLRSFANYPLNLWPNEQRSLVSPAENFKNYGSIVDSGSVDNADDPVEHV